jgi:hypothetical protein
MRKPCNNNKYFPLKPFQFIGEKRASEVKKGRVEKRV